MSTRIISFKEAIREAQEQCLEAYPECFIIGEGVGDAKNIFGTTAGLKEKFPGRVFDMPISENGGTGVSIGAAINGSRPILVHQRMDFSLYSADQLINNAAKWHSMFGGQRSVPLVVRMIIGRGWGQGNQHSQNLTALYAHVPGLKIVMPSNAASAKGLFHTAVLEPNPVLFIEHRWLYETTSEVPEHPYLNQLDATTTWGGNDVTIVASGHAFREAFKAREFLQTRGVSVELIDLHTIKPLPIDLIIGSARRTHHLIVVDDAWRFGGVAAEIIASVCEDEVIEAIPDFRVSRVTYPDYPSGSSPALTKHYYPEALEICMAVKKSLGLQMDLSEVYDTHPVHDVPDANFRGPF